MRLSRANAATLYALVEEQGVLNTTVTLTGSAQVALARNPRGRQDNALARRDPYQQYSSQYDDSGEPVMLAPQAPQRRLIPQARVDDGYIYPADGSSTDARYPAPRSVRRTYDGQVYYQQQPTYDSRGYDPQYAPQQRYYQQRGLFGYPN